MRILRALAAALAVAILSVAAAADPFPVVPPESMGLSSERLERISHHLQADVAKGTIPGAVMLISRRVAVEEPYCAEHNHPCTVQIGLLRRHGHPT